MLITTLTLSTQFCNMETILAMLVPKVKAEIINIKHPYRWPIGT